MESYTAFILILLGLVFKFPEASTVNTTKTYYIELEIESGAFTKFKELLGNLTVVNDPNDTASVTNISITADCQVNGTMMNCNCGKGNRLSDDVQMKYQCYSNKTYCSINYPYHMVVCQSENRVIVNGSFTVQRPDIFYINPEEKIYKELDTNFTRELTSVYSSLNWFDSLWIIQLRQGSIIGDFMMLLNSAFDVFAFENLTDELESKMNATFSLVTIGFIDISHHELIGSDEAVNITCTPQMELGEAKWFLQRSGDEKQAITNGAESSVYDLSPKSTLSIIKTSKAWKGTFTCDFTSKKKSIIHRASVYLDVAIYPDILITSDPQFPNCKSNPTSVLPVTVKCFLSNSTEPYSIDWSGAGGSKNPQTNPGKNSIYYEGKTNIECYKTQETYNVTCTFTNRKNQTTSASLEIPIITSTSTVCKSDNSWPEAKVNYTATQQCENSEVGLIERQCFENGQYGQIISKCVNVNLQSLLNSATDLRRGIGYVGENALNVFRSLKESTETTVTTTFANINASVDVMDIMQNASETQRSQWNDSMLIDIVKSSSNLLNNSLLNAWNQYNNEAHNLAIKYLKTFEKVLNRTNITSTDLDIQQENVNTSVCNNQSCNNAFNISSTGFASKMILQSSIKNLVQLLPKPEDDNKMVSNGMILSLIPLAPTTNISISMQFQTNRPPNHMMYCVYFDLNSTQWSEAGCKWGGVSNPNLCTCSHLTPFTILMSKNPLKLPYMDLLTYTGLGFSVGSLTLCLVIEFMVWNTVVKSNISHFRHTVMVNIVLCLLIAHSSFLAHIGNISVKQWCLILTVLKHFCFLAAFSWMMCLSMGLLHQVVLVFVHLRKKVYLGLCFSLGYVCPLIIVTATIITYNNGASGSYYKEDTCWLIYEKPLKGSIHSFVLPAGVIVFVNMFTMVLVISKILKPTMSELKTHDDKELVRSIIKTVIVLTPTLGITWLLGFFVLTLDLTQTPWAEIANYAFTFFNSFQGFFILLTGCLGEKRVRDALLSRLKNKHSTKMKSESIGSKKAASKRK